MSWDDYRQSEGGARMAADIVWAALFVAVIVAALLLLA